MRSASLMAKCSSSISARMSKSMFPACFSMILRCSASSVGITLSLLAIDRETRPRARNGARVLPGEEHRDEHAQHLIVRQSAAVLVPRVNERLQDVGFARARLAARLDHLVEDGGELLASLVALAVRLDGGVGKEDRQGHHALVEIVDEVGHLGEEGLADLSSEEASGRGEDDEFGEGVEEVHLAGLAPLAEVVFRLLDHHTDVLAETVGLEGVGEEAKLLGTGLMVDVEDDALAEGGDVEFVNLLLAHLRVLRLEEVLRHLGADEERDALVKDGDCGKGGRRGRVKEVSGRAIAAARSRGAFGSNRRILEGRSHRRRFATDRAGEGTHR